jgi:hypothetical protein
MCNLYSITTNQAAIIALFRVMNRYLLLGISARSWNAGRRFQDYLDDLQAKGLDRGRPGVR